MLDSAQEKRLQRTVVILETSSLQSTLSRQIQELTGPAHHTTRRLHQNRKTRSLPPQLHNPRCSEQSVQRTSLPKLRHNESGDPFFQSPCLPCLDHEVLVVPSATQLHSFVLRVVFLVPARTISSPKRRAFCRWRCPPNFHSKKVLVSLSLSPWCLCESIFVISHFEFSVRVGRGISRDGLVYAATCSSSLVWRVLDTTESLCHLAESTLLSHEVSDDFS